MSAVRSSACSSIATIVVVTGVTSIVACSTVKNGNATYQSTKASESFTKVLVLGDIQQKDEFLLKGITTFDRSQWDSHGVDTKNVASLNPQAILKALKPDAILQVGDFVDFNNSLEISVQSATGQLSTLKPRYNEWKVILDYLDTSIPAYPTIGNHETYKLVRFHGTESADGKISITGGPNPKAGDISFTTGEERESMLKAQFPHLKTNATFFGATGTYFSASENYCLLSIDGASIVNKNIDIARSGWQSLKPFIEQSLSRCSVRKNNMWIPLKPSVVMVHYPLFSALSVGEQEFLPEIATDIVETFNTFRVALVLSGHEHLYMRYLDQGLKEAGYSSLLPLETTYVTIANFGVPGDNSAKLRGIGKTPSQNRQTRVAFQPPFSQGSLASGNGSKFFLKEEPTFAFMQISKDSVKFVAKSKSGDSWTTVDSFGLKLGDDARWKRTDAIAR